MIRENDIPLVSIITPTRNRKRFLKETADYIKEQNYKSWEWIIIDDGSTDGTEELLKSLEKGDHRIHFHKRSQDHLQGPAGCRNQAIDLAKGTLVIFVDDDDIIHPDLLNLTTGFLAKYPDADYIRFDKQPFKRQLDKNCLLPFDNLPEKPQVFKNSEIEKMITGEIPFACCTVMWKKKDLEKERFNEDLSYAEEWEYYSRLLLKSKYGFSLNKALYFNRKHSKSNTGEFWANDPVRRKSKIEATRLVISNLKKNNLLNAQLFQFFIRLGFFLKSYEIIREILDKTEANCVKRIKYKMGYLFYPLIRPVFKLKGKILQGF